MDITVDKNGNRIFLEEWENVQVIPSVLSKEQCEGLIADADFLNTPNNKPQYGANSGPSNDIERRNFSDHPIIKELSDKYGWECSNSPILWYKVGVSSLPHADSFAYNGRDSNKDNVVERIKPWKRTALIFLNDDFEGGELVYPKIGVTIKPKTGSIVLSSCGYEFLHYTENASKNKYVLVIRINN